MISLVVPTHGRRDLLQAALDSLAVQEGAPPFEIVVVDDGADAALGEWVGSLGHELDIQVLHHEVNRGRSAARNTGIRAARGNAIVFLDGDMRVVPGFVAAHAAAHAGGGDTVALGNILTAPEVGGSAFVDYIDARGVKKVRPGEEIPARYFMTGNSSVAAPMLKRAGEFDEEFGEYGGEDTEMGYRLAAHGARFRYAVGAVSYHMDLNTVPEMAERLRRYGERMLPILVRKVPQARRDLRLYLAEPPSPGDGVALTISRWAARALAHRAVWAPLARVADRWPRSIRVDLLFDVVRAAAYLDGYARAIRTGR